MNPLRKIPHNDSLQWRSPPNPCGPSSPQSPPPLEVRGKSLSLNRVTAPLAPIREVPTRELSKKSRKQRLLLSQAGSLSLKRRETSPDFCKLEARLKPKRGEFVTSQYRLLETLHVMWSPRVRVVRSHLR